MNNINNKQTIITTVEQAIEQLHKCTYKKEFQDFYNTLSETLKSNHEICKAFIEADIENYHYIPKNLKENRNFNLDLLKSNYFLFNRIPKHFLSDRKIVETGISRYGSLLRYVKNLDFLDDEDLILKAVSTYGLSLQFASNRLKNDLNIVKKAISDNGSALEFASENLKNDLNLVTEAIHRKSEAFSFVGDSFIEDPKTIFFIDPINFLVISRTLKQVDVFQKMRENLKNYHASDTSLRMEDFFSEIGNWNLYLRMVDVDFKDSDNSSINEAYYYLSFMLPHWKNETIIEFKNYLSHPDLHFENKEVANFFDKTLNKEFYRRKLEKDMEILVLVSNKKAQNKRKIF